MTSVDDSLLGAGPVRSAKTGAKAVIGQGAKNDAFESAVADAGKKKQSGPQISIGTKAQDDVNLRLPNRVAAGQNDMAAQGTASIKAQQDAVVKASDLTADMPVQDTDRLATLSLEESDKTPVQNRAPKDDPYQASVEPETSPTEPATRSLPNQALKATVLQALTLAGNQPQETQADVVEGEVIKIVAGHVKASITTGKQDTNSNVEQTDAPVAEETGDVSQLLAMLGSPATVQASSAASAAEATMQNATASEFQALADRAGSAKADGPVSDTTKEKQAVVSADSNAVDNATAAGTDQVFRFARADGKGQAVSMTMNTDGDKASARIEAAATRSDAAAAKAETVTVLDSRRYLGIAANTNSQAVATTITGSTAWAQAMQPSSGLSSPEAASAAGKVVNTLKIQMHPIDLGMVTATLRLKDDELQIDLRVESGEAFRQLTDDQNAMIKALRAQGFAVDQINITFNAAPDTSSGNTGSQQSQAQAGQQGRDASGDGTQQGRGRNDDGAQARSSDRWTGNEAIDDKAAVEPSGVQHTYM